MFPRNLLKLHRFAQSRRRYSNYPVKLNICEPCLEMVELKNGIRVATEQTSSNLACISLFIQAGPRFENRAYHGINHFIEHMAFKGSAKMPKRNIEDYVASTGSRLDAKTTQEIQRFSVTCTPEWIQNAVVLLCGIINQTELDPNLVEHEKRNIYIEMEEADKNYKTLVFENLIQSAFQGTRLGRTVVGPWKNVESFDSAMACTYMRTQYQPWRIVFASSAPVKNDCIATCVRQELGSMKVAYQLSDKGTTRFTSSSVLYRDDSKKFVHVAIAFEAPGFLSGNYIGMRLFKNVVGSWSKSDAVFGPFPELAKRCADTELCHLFESFYIAFGDVGLFGVYFVGGTMEAEDFIYNWQDVLKNVCTTLTYADLQRAKQATKMELYRERAGVFNSSVDLGKELLYRNTRPSLIDYSFNVDVILPNELRELAYNTVYNAQPVISAAGPTEGLPDYTRLAAGTYWMRW